MFSLFKNFVSADRWGIWLSSICALHCALVPLLALAVPTLGIFDEPWVHVVLALLIIPIGLVAFVRGYRHHLKLWILLMAVPGLVIVGFLPLFFHEWLEANYESELMIVGSLMLVLAHWFNRRSCACELHAGSLAHTESASPPSKKSSPMIFENQTDRG